MFKRNLQLVDNKGKTAYKLGVSGILEKIHSSYKLIIPNKTFSKIQRIVAGLGLKDYPHIHTTNTSNKVFI